MGLDENKGVTRACWYISLCVILSEMVVLNSNKQSIAQKLRRNREKAPSSERRLSCSLGCTRESPPSRVQSKYD